MGAQQRKVDLLLSNDDFAILSPDGLFAMEGLTGPSTDVLRMYLAYAGAAFQEFRR